MSRHVITLQPPFDGTAVFICCSCSDEPIAKVGYPEAAASLVEVNEIAHRHIECSERYDRLRDSDTGRTYDGGGRVYSAPYYGYDGLPLGTIIRRALDG